jgi:hypothetical protein
MMLLLREILLLLLLREILLLLLRKLRRELLMLQLLMKLQFLDLHQGGMTLMQLVKMADCFVECVATRALNTDLMTKCCF